MPGMLPAPSATSSAIFAVLPLAESYSTSTLPMVVCLSFEVRVKCLREGIVQGLRSALHGLAIVTSRGKTARSGRLQPGSAQGILVLGPSGNADRQAG